MLSDAFKTTTLQSAPLDGSLRGAAAGSSTTSVSDFLTVQAFTNFATMTGAIYAAWKGLGRLDGNLSALWVPYLFSGLFGLLSIVVSADGLKKPNVSKLDWGKVGVAVFVALINAVVLANAVVGTATVEPGSGTPSGPPS